MPELTSDRNVLWFYFYRNGDMPISDDAYHYVPPVNQWGMHFPYIKSNVSNAEVLTLREALKAAYSLFTGCTRFNNAPVSPDFKSIKLFLSDGTVRDIWGKSSLLYVVTPPTKTSYNVGETISYAGITMKFFYPDGSQHNVTEFCDFSPVSGTTVSSDTTLITVSCAPSLTPDIFDYNNGYVANGVWSYEYPTKCYLDIYSVQSGHKYLIALGNTVGTRFRVMFTTADITTANSGAKITGTNIISGSNPAANASITFTAPSDGYIVIQKDNAGVTGLKSFLYDANSTNKTETEGFAITVNNGG